MTANIFNVQRFSIHDGEGIRTTIFFKGCPLSCMWCHNPESLSFNREIMYDSSKCTGCGECTKHCVTGALKVVDGKITRASDDCTMCGNCSFYCVNQVFQPVGTIQTVDDVFKKAMADKLFYEESRGGVTLSGGEPLMYIDFVEELAKRIFEAGVRLNIDTSGAVDFSRLERISKYTDTFLYDIKHTDRELFKEFIGGDCDLVLNNLTKLSKIHNSIIARMPIIGGVNDNEEHIQKTIELIKKCNENQNSIKEVNLLVYHNISTMKYKKLGKKYNSELMSVPSNEKMQRFADMFKINGIKVSIGG